MIIKLFSEGKDVNIPTVQRICSEPYVSDKDENENSLGVVNNVAVTNSFLLTPKDKIVCMRIYERKFDKNDKRHFLDVRDDVRIISLDNCSIINHPVLSEELETKRDIIINYSQ